MRKLQPRGGLARNNTLLLKKKLLLSLYPPIPPQQLCRKLLRSALRQNPHGLKNLFVCLWDRDCSSPPSCILSSTIIIDFFSDFFFSPLFE